MNPLAVTAACYLADYRLAVSFSDGTTQEIDFAPVLDQFAPADYRAVYRQPAQFRAFAIENGNLVWGADWDLIFPVWKLHQNRLTVAVH